MTAPHAKSLRRRIVSTILWTLALLLLTNVFWSATSAMTDATTGGGEFGYIDGTADRALVVQSETGLLVSEYVVEVWAAPVTNLHGPTVPFPADIAPHWLEQVLDQQEGLMDMAIVESSSFRAVGWPIRCLWVGTHPSGDLIRFTGCAVELLSANSPFRGVLPIRPILTGQLFYAAFWLAIVIAIPFTRRRFRIWRGRCLNCNYEMRANTTGVCPECGVKHGEGNPNETVH